MAFAASPERQDFRYENLLTSAMGWLSMEDWNRSQNSGHSITLPEKDGRVSFGSWTLRRDGCGAVLRPAAAVAAWAAANAMACIMSGELVGVGTVGWACVVSVC